ncbi:Cys-tRNA(Pro) deacylase [Natronosporangium hydrolyticum]|uniref:Cys-tRNA(Pro)/Cys-tRNA(Cys) deacylase n=1 Tax=Natronosporangium hydrolyticum TaxID=2811111 RepID=A0A895YHR2_9ACTN|nr:Cys-tRNA(Pro) deacylase [Natronosporangium hydrolyticum]QSB15575.1 Cys-tRNA(Pro) deacylase [Natronosporangium hydrolyticum]
MGSANTPAVALLRRQRTPHGQHPYEVPVGAEYGRSVAAALGVALERVCKTLVATVDGVLTVAVVPVSGELDLKALAAAAGGKRAAVADRAAAERATGYVRGGISPLGQKRRLPTVVDASVTEFDTVYVSGGRRGLQVSLSPADLIRLTDATVAAIARPIMS